MTFASPQLQAKNKTPFIQPKLTIGQPGDKYEKEADTMADQVMRMPQHDNSIQRKCKNCEEESLQMKPLGAPISPMIQRQTSVEEEETVQMKSDGGKESSFSNLSDQLNQSKGKGNNLSDSTNGFMSKSFGTDFSRVKIHTDSSAVQMNRALGARAFTHGNDVYFNKGEYNPSTGNGKHLLAHELTHVVQQGGIQNKVSKKPLSKAGTYIAMVPKTCQNDRDGNLWYGTKGEAETRRNKLIKDGVCTMDTCRISEFPNPKEKGEVAYRVVICKAGKKKETKPKEDKKQPEEKKPQTTKSKRQKPNNNSCPQGRAKKVTRDSCSSSNPINSKNYIEKLVVNLSKYTVTATWTDGSIDVWACTPNRKDTPKGTDLIGVKCGIKHTNWSKDGMAFFTSFKSTGYRIGFHNSQPVGKGFKSHGCVRVRCGVAEVINKNTWSDKTTISVI